MSEKKVFSKEERQKIVEDFVRRHNGQYDPSLFLKEVKEAGKDHPAYDWFEWNTKKAANEYNLWQARAFAKDLRVSFNVEEVGRSGAVTVRAVEAPMVISPTSRRSDGGGYVSFDPSNPEHMTEHCHQAASALRSWLRRYEAALVHAGCGVKTIEQVVDGLDAVKAPATAEVAA